MRHTVRRLFSQIFNGTRPPVVVVLYGSNYSILIGPIYWKRGCICFWYSVRIHFVFLSCVQLQYHSTAAVENIFPNVDKLNRL